MPIEKGMDTLPNLQTAISKADFNVPNANNIAVELAELAISYFDLAHVASQEEGRTMPSPYEADRFGRGEGLTEALAKLARPKIAESLKLHDSESDYSIWCRILHAERQRRKELSAPAPR